MEVDMDVVKSNSMEMVELKKESEGEEGYATCIGHKEKKKEIDDVAVAEFDRSKGFIPKRICHRFYFVKFRSYEEELKARARITKDLGKKKLERENIISKLNHRDYFGERLAWKRKEMEQYEVALDQIQRTQQKEEDIKHIKMLHYKIQHGSKSLAEEKKLLREIKQIEAAMEDAALKPKIPHDFGSQEVIQHIMERFRNQIDELQKTHQAFLAKVKPLERELEVAEKYIVCLERKLTGIQDAVLQPRKDSDEMNEWFHQYLSLLENAKELKRKKDVAALKELSNVQVEKFMSQWNNNKAFRVDYVKRMLPSLGR